MTSPTSLATLPVAHWPESAQADYAERAAILEYESGYSRREAERLAREMVIAAWAMARGGGATKREE